MNSVRCLTLLLTLAVLDSAGGSEPVRFETDVAPILSRRCIRCHSPQANDELISLATPEDLQDGDYIVPGQPDRSRLISLVTANVEERPAMPSEGEPLTSTEVAALKQWIADGAKWPEGFVVRSRSRADTSWWSLQPIADDPVPAAVENAPEHWTTHPIDRFILDRLRQEGLQPSEPADRRTLIRRLSFDLHGLPPTPQQIDEFLEDDQPRAWERLVDRMLESHHYGERYARHWLDLAHYADTHGFERDKRRDNAWRYRDYVIRAFNDDTPYNLFLQEQIAGDVLWPDNEQAVIATGFLAAGPWDFVGQVETKSPVLRRSARSLDLDDMATQVMTSTMAITVNCARCHDHKLDPIPQREYYQLRAVFAGIRRAERDVSQTAVERYEQQRRQLIDERDRIDYAIARLEGAGLDLADIVGGGNGLGTGTFRQGIDARTAKIQTRDFGKLGNVVTNRFVKSDFEFIDGVLIPDGMDGQSALPVSSTGLTLTGLPTTSGAAWDMIRNGPVASQHSPELDGVDFTTDGHSLLGLHANAGITFDLAAIRNSTKLTDMALTCRLGYFGAAGSFQADVWIAVDGELQRSFLGLTRADGLQTVELELPRTTRFLTLLATDGGNGFSHDQIGFGDPRLKPATPTKLSTADQHRLAQLKTERKALADRLRDLGSSPKFYGVVNEAELPEVRVLQRGNPETPIGEPLSPAALSSLSMLNPALGTIETDAGHRRVALARWITHPDNPLTRRVIANRLWQWHFGEGLVATSSDFGFGGGRPSHPELLDWLAAELPRHNWSLKTMHRLILTSATYRQSSQVPATHRGFSVDADNRLLWRQNSRRIEAEAIRDSVLAVSGKLNLQRGGPGFEDFEYRDAYAPIYSYVTADQPELWRRSIYRYIVRTTPNRFLTTLDCPDPANLTAQRLTTTTPLQSLALYNNDFMLRQSRYFAERLRSDAGVEPTAQIRQAFRLCFGREPTGRELELAVPLVQQHGLFTLCRSLFNASEFVHVD